MNVQLVEVGNKTAKGSGKMDIEFSFYHVSTDSLICSEKVSISVTKQESYFYLIDQMIAESVKQLICTETLYDKLAQGSAMAVNSPVGAEIIMEKLSFPEAKDKKELFNRLVKGTVTIKTERGFGSGVVVSSDGYIITNQHVIDGESEFKVEFSEGLSLDARLLKQDELYDLALLKVEASGLKALSFGDSEELSLGEEVYAIGTGGDSKLGQSVSKGIVSGFRILDDIPYIQTDVSINPGNSGGPLVNEKGELMGIATMKLMGDGVEGIGFCLPVNKIIEVLNIKFK
jgi:S1-C subfamily serine protease